MNMRGVTILAFLLSAGALACDSGKHRGIVGEACGVIDDCLAGLLCTGGRCVEAPVDRNDAAVSPPTGGTGGSGPVDEIPPLELARARTGCGDGEREALADVAAYPNIAACSGGWWKRAGIAQGWSPECKRRGGDDAEGDLRSGLACVAQDLCAEGWHICKTGDDMVAHGLATCAEIPSPAPGDTSEALFFATAQPGFDAQTGGGTTCYANNVGANNVFGCAIGNIAAPLSNASCEPYGFRMLAVREGLPFDCSLYPPWDCGTTLTEKQELEAVTKYGPSRGGVLCCRDDLLKTDAGAP